MALQEQVTILSCVKSYLSERERGFADSLIQQFHRRGGLSEKQARWVEQLTRQAQGEGGKPSGIGDVKGVIDFLERAKKHLKLPKLLIRVDGVDLRLAIAGSRSKAPGSISVTSAERGDGGERVWFGRITREGVFEPSYALAKASRGPIESALRALARDPAKVASDYGKLTSTCCFCALPLTDERSIAVGYGRICADHWGLPWGDK